MSFGLDIQCATVVIRKGKVVRSTGINIDCNTHMKGIDAEETCRYLGMEETMGINQQLIKKRIKKEYYQRVRQILKTQLNAKNKIWAINSLAMPVITYIFGVVDRLRSDLQKIDRKTRKLLILAGAYRQNADIDKLYFNRLDGGRGHTLYLQRLVLLGHWVKAWQET